MSVTNELEICLKREVLKESYFEFFKWSFGILKPNEKYEDAFHIKYLCDRLQEEVMRMVRKEEKGRDIIINIPPRTSKSLITSVCLMPWVWLHIPSAPFICVSYEDKLSLVNAQMSKDLIKSDEFVKLFGDCYEIRRDADSKEYYASNKGGARLSTTTQSSVTGFSALIEIVDDPQNPKTAESEVKRDEINKFYFEALYNRLTPANLGLRLIIMQRLNVLDLSGKLLSEYMDEYEHICLPAEYQDNIKPVELGSHYKDGLLDPIRLNRKVLAGLKKALGSRGYAGQYDQRPSPEEGGIFKGAYFDIIEPEELRRDIDNEPVNFVVDSAYTAKTENDPSAVLTFFKKGGDLYILDATERWMEFPQLIEFLKNHTGRYQYTNQSRLLVEEAASGLSIIQQMRSCTNLNVIGIKKPKDDKITRAYAITAILEAKRVKLVRGGYIDAFLNQLLSFPNGAHDDMVDTLIHAVSEFLMSDSPDFLFI